jgi:hypothetical protein
MLVACWFSLLGCGLLYRLWAANVHLEGVVIDPMRRERGEVWKLFFTSQGTASLADQRTLLQQRCDKDPVLSRKPKTDIMILIPRCMLIRNHFYTLTHLASQSHPHAVTLGDRARCT